MRLARPRPRHALCCTLACVLLGPGTAPLALAAPEAARVPVHAVPPLLALAAERGEAHGVLIGPGADYVRRRFDASAPIEIDVRRLHPLPQPGCHRLEVVTRQHGVRVSGTRSDQELAYQLSFCRNGRFPASR